MTARPPFPRSTRHRRAPRGASRFVTGRGEIVKFLTKKWEREEGLMRRREASINDLKISESERRIFGTRPKEEYGVPFPLQ